MGRDEGDPADDDRGPKNQMKRASFDSYRKVAEIAAVKAQVAYDVSTIELESVEHELAELARGSEEFEEEVAKMTGQGMPAALWGTVEARREQLVDEIDQVRTELFKSIELQKSARAALAATRRREKQCDKIESRLDLEDRKIEEGHNQRELDETGSRRPVDTSGRG